MSAVLSIVLILLAAVGAFFLGRWHGLSTGTKELTEELENKDKELEELKSGVNEHFDETARLFSNLTEEYKTLYQHLAKGANSLSDKDFQLKLSAPVGSDTLSSGSNNPEASAAEVIDAEGHLTPEKPKDDASSHEEESFIRSSSDDIDSDGAASEETASEKTDPEETASDKTSANSEDGEPKPDLDIEVSPPKDWADDDMDDDYRPNDSRSGGSEFTDLANEAEKKPSAPGFEKSSHEEAVNESEQSEARTKNQDNEKDKEKST